MWKQEQEAENSHAQTQAQAERANGVESDYMISKPISSDILLTASQHHISLPKQCYQLGTKFSNTSDYEGHFSFKLPQMLGNNSEEQ